MNADKTKPTTVGFAMLLPRIHSPERKALRFAIDPSAEYGRGFFNNLRKLKRIVGGRNYSDKDLPDVFDAIADCRGFVYAVRNNIFHGRKTLASQRC